MKILIVTRGSTKDMSSWSGITLHARRELESDHSLFDIDFYFFVLDLIDRLVYKLLFWASPVLLKREIRFHLGDMVPVSKISGRLIGLFAKLWKIDLVFGASCVNHLAFIPKSIPVAHMVGGTYELLKQSGKYEDYSNLPETLERHYHSIEIAGASRIDLFFVPSEGASEALQQYGAAVSKIHVIGYGPNLDDKTIVDCRKVQYDEPICKLVFAGYDWKRKGGHNVLQVANTLKARGVPVELHIIGPKRVDLADCNTPVIFHGKVDKRLQEFKYANIVAGAFYFLLLTEAELFGVVFVEAAALSTPSVAFRIGGVPNALLDNKTGHLFDESCDLSNIADRIENDWIERSGYDYFRSQVGVHFDNYLSWKSWRARVNLAFSEI